MTERSDRYVSVLPAEKRPTAPKDDFLAGVVQKADIMFGGRHPVPLIAVIAILLALLTRFPHYGTLSGLRQRVENQALCWQVRHPLTPIPADLEDLRLHGPPASHVDKMELRLTVPLLGHVSRTGAWTVVVWSSIAAALLFYFLAVCARDAMRDTTATAFFVIGLGATFFGTWGFNDFICGDAVAFVLMLLSVCFLKRPWLCGVCFLGAAFCDERSVIAAPLLLLYLMIRYSQPQEKKQRDKLTFTLMGTIGVWLVLRWWLQAAFGLSTGTSLVATWDTFRAHVVDRQTYLSFVGLFRASWIILVLAVRRLILERKWLLAGWLVAAFGLVAAPAFLVVNFNRSLCYAFPIFLISLRVLWHDTEAPKKYLALVALANILLSPPSKTILRFLA